MGAITLKSKTYTESTDVDVAGISVKATVHYPGRYSFTWHKQLRLRVPKEPISKVRGPLKTVFRSGRGRNLQNIITEELNSVISGWINYFRLAEVKTFAEELDGLIRRKRLVNAGLSEERAVMLAFKGETNFKTVLIACII